MVEEKGVSRICNNEEEHRRQWDEEEKAREEVMMMMILLWREMPPRWGRESGENLRSMRKGGGRGEEGRRRGREGGRTGKKAVRGISGFPNKCSAKEEKFFGPLPKWNICFCYFFRTVNYYKQIQSSFWTQMTIYCPPMVEMCPKQTETLFFIKINLIQEPFWKTEWIFQTMAFLPHHGHIWQFINRIRRWKY